MHISQADYLLCKVLYSLSSVLDDFPCAEMREEIERILSLIQKKSFNVAVVGEFRRGKSSLINALLGMPVLPVDIEPTTAAVNRVTYGLKPKAIVHFKDGTSEEVPIEDLENYVTKLNPTAAKTAETVKEAEIQYPTELCSNNIDIIDTPGLNDTENMTLVTESLLNDVHMAVVAVNATMTYSETECHWVTRLLSLPKLNHIVFVLTFMDQVKKSDVRKVLEAAKHRICEKTMEKVNLNYCENEEVIKKATRIFSDENFSLYPVSAILALDSFENGDYELLEESKIVPLKKGLITAMNSQQQLGGLYATENLIYSFKSWFSTISAADTMKSFEDQAEALSTAEIVVRDYFTNRTASMDEKLRAVSSEVQLLIDRWLSEDNLTENIRATYIKHLSSVTVNSNEAVKAAVRNAERDINMNILQPIADGLRKGVNAAIVRNVNDFLAERDKMLHYEEYLNIIEESGIPYSGMIKSAVVRQLQEGFKIDVPDITFTLPSLLMNQNIMKTLIAPNILIFVKRFRKAWYDVIPEYAKKWYATVLSMEPSELYNRFENVVFKYKGSIAEKKNSQKEKYSRVENLIAREEETVNMIKGELLT